MGMAIQVPQFTIDMLDALPDDGSRYELLEGMLIVTPAASLAHQIVATRLAVELSKALEPEGIARVVAVGAIQRGEKTQLQPDILVCPAQYPPSTDWRDISGWWLAIEVMSPSSRVYDREVKRGAYLALGVEEYWLVDLADCSVEVWTSADETGRQESAVLHWKPSALDREIGIDLREIFSGICEEQFGAGDSPHQ